MEHNENQDQYQDQDKDQDQQQISHLRLHLDIQTICEVFRIQILSPPVIFSTPDTLRGQFVSAHKTSSNKTPDGE